MGEKTVQSVAFEEDGTIILGWADPKEQDDRGGTAHQTYVTIEGQEHDSQVAYYTNELRGDVIELLEAVLAARKK